MLALLLPWLLLLLIIIAVVCLILKKWKISLLLLLVIICINWWIECIPAHLWQCPNNKEDRMLRVLCFNVNGTSGDVYDKARRVREFLRDNPTDLFFIAEFNERQSKPLDSLLRQYLPYSTYPDDDFFYHYFYGRYPLLNKRRVSHSDDDEVGIFICSTIIQGDTIDFYGCHFASNNYNENNDRMTPNEIEDENDAYSYIKNIRQASKIRIEEANAVISEITKSNHRVILLGDLNDVCGSTTIRLLENSGLKDAWWESGLGYGATILSPLPYRIDHILFSKGLKIKRIKVLDSNGISDHNALYAVFSIE